MNESEARRVALTAAVAWCCYTPEGRAELSTDAMLAYAEQFETWLLRPASVNVVAPVVSAPEQRGAQLSGRWATTPPPLTDMGCACTFRSTHAACTSCGHDAHDPGTCPRTWEYTKPTPVVTIPEQREAPRTRPNPWCTHCEHEPHAGPTCRDCACTGKAPEAPRCRNCHHDVSTHASHGCTHGREHMDSGTCGCPYTAVDFRKGNAPSVVTLPEQRGDASTDNTTKVHDAPCTGFRQGVADSSYGCVHTRLAHGLQGCSVTGCRCERGPA